MNDWLPRFSVTRPVTVVMVFLALSLLGSIAWDRIPLEMMPGRFTLNRLWVWVPYDGASPRETEANLLRPVEEAVSTSPGIKSMRGSARDNGIQLSLEFHRSVSMDVAYNSVVDRMERAMPDLPDDVERYWIYKWNPADEPVMWSGISLPDGIEDEHGLVNDYVAKRLERVPGVGKVDVWGVDPKRVFVDFNLDLLSMHGVNLGEVIGSLAQDNFQLASGRVVDGGRVRYVRSLARWQSIDELRAIPVKPGVTVGDIADIEYRLDPSPDINHIDGREGAALAINKESDANTVAVTEAVEAAFAELEADPRLQGARFVTFFDQGSLIQDSIDDLLMTAATGGLCAIVVLFAFLREWRLTLLIAACIPFTLLLTVTITYFTGRSLNLLTLMGLMLAVGMVVDNAIVVVESIYARRQLGEGPKPAAIRGTGEVVLAITLSTLTTMVVFLPIILMTEDADFSFFMGELGMPVVWALGASLMVAVVFTPLSTTLLKGERGSLPKEPRWITWLTTRYRRWLAAVLTHRTDALVGVVAFTVLTVLVPAKSVGCQDQADGNVGQFVVRFEVPADFTYTERLDTVDALEAWVEDHRDEWGIRTHRSQLGADSSYGRLYIHLTEDSERDEALPAREDVIKQAQESLPRLPGVETQIGWGGSGRGQNREIEITIRGDEVEMLETLGEEVRRVVKGLPGVISASTDLEEGGGQELRLVADRQALARYGQTATGVGQTVGFALRGTQLPDYHDDGKEVEVVSRFRYEDREDLDRLLDFPMWSATSGQSVPLRALVDPEVAPGFGTIRRTDRVTSFPLTVELEPDADSLEVRAAIRGALDGMAFPRGYAWDFFGGGPTSPENDSARNLALLLSVTFVFLIMGVLFESFLLPLSIITSIPMALVGVYWTLYLTSTPLDVMGGVGLVILVGVVVNNGIVLIDLVTRLRGEGLSRTDALVEAGGRRLRPILMTALTTIFGLLPMALGTSTFIGIPYAPMGRVVAGGMVAGTVLTLFFVPYLYSVLDDMRASGGRWVAWVTGPADPSGAPPRPAK